VFRKHHAQNGPSSQPAVEPARAEAVILDWATSQLYRTKVRLTVGLKFDDGQTVEFIQEIPDIVLPQSGDFAARIAALSQEPISLPLSVGNKIPVCYDPADRNRMWIDEPTLHETAIRAHDEKVQARRARAEALLEASDPVPGQPPGH
jgi:hypothetical protein